MTDVSIGLAGCGAGFAGLMKRSLLLRWAGAGGLLEPTGWRVKGTLEGGCIWPQVTHRVPVTISESLGDGACNVKPRKQNFQKLIKLSVLYIGVQRK